MAEIFQPVRGTEAIINDLNATPIREGYIYFAYDSGNIYIDKNGNRYHMGGGTAGVGIIYAHGEEEDIVKVDDFDDLDFSYYIPFSVIDNLTSIPVADSLILNSDGRFFRVLSTDEQTRKVTALLLAVSGTGSSSGEIIPIVEDLFIIPTTSTIGSSFTYVYGQNYDAEVTVNSTTDEEIDLTVNFYANNNLSSEPIYTILKRGQPAGEPIKINMGEVTYVGSSVAIVLTAEAANSKMPNGVTKRYNNIRFVDMKIEKHADSDYIPIRTNSSDLQLKYIPYGKGLNVTLHTLVDNKEIPNNANLIDDNMGNQQTINIPKQSDGTHIIELYLSAIVNGSELQTDRISYQASWAIAADAAPLIWLGDIPELVIQYNPAIINYMVFDAQNEAVEAPTVVEFYQGKTKISSSEVRYSNDGWLKWDVTGLYTPGLNQFIIKCGDTRRTISFEVTTEGARDLSLAYPSALVMNFDSLGRDNQEIKSSRESWKSTVGNYEAQFHDINWYNNGWKNNDDNNGSYLSLTNGASMDIPFRNIALGSNADTWTFELRFRVKNAHKYATLVTEIPLYKYKDANGVENTIGNELTLEEIAAIGGTPIRDGDGNLVMEESNTTRKITETSNNVAIKYLNSANQGFCIGTQEAYFRTPGKTVNVRYKEDEIVNISFVSNGNKTLSIYLNGILSGAIGLSGIPQFVMNNSKFIFNSDYCDIDIFKFRIYNTALDMPQIIHNYIADIKNIELYDENQLADTNDQNALSYNKLVEYNETHSNQPTMPYVVIDMTETEQGPDLPHFKGAKRAVSITFTNPTADYLLDIGEISEWEYYTHCPSYTAKNVELDVQGTSSQIYPRRNFKAKFKKAKNWVFTHGPLTGYSIADAWYFDKTTNRALPEITAETYDKNTMKKLNKKWHVDSELLSTNKFTWKIDYMESSGSYNTGFANLMGNGVYSKHPLEDLNINDLDASIYRTSVYGFPMLAFHKTAEDSYTYIGRYNMNLDKGSNEYYGFEEEVEQPYVNAPWEDKDGNIHEHPYIKDVAECWELRDNQGTWCSFRYPNAEMRAARFRAQMPSATPDNPKVEVANHFEARYHVNADQFEYAQNIVIGKENTEDFSDDIGGATTAAASNYVVSKLANLQVLFDWLDSTDTAAVNMNNLQNLNNPVEFIVSNQLNEEEALLNGVSYEDRIVNGVTKTIGIFTKDSIEYRRQKFYAEFDKHLDKHYCAIYFVMTELLLCYDSRGKNMMIASFGPREIGGDYIWYPIFYDIDTQLGLNNVGAKLWDYDEDCSENGTFSTASSVLWNNFYDLFKENIITTYRSLRSTKLDYTTIEGAYICDPNVFRRSYAMRGKRPIIAIGLDEYYKYVLPTTQPWKNQEGAMITANYLYACQGDRILSRELLINNRLLYMDSKWLGGTFTITSGGMAGIMFRGTANHYRITSDKYLDSTNVADGQVSAQYPVPFFDAIPEYYVTPYLNFYVTTFVDENISQVPEPYTAEKYPNGIPTIVSDSVLESYKSGTVDQQLNYFAGSSYISSLGDLSTKYVNQVKYPNAPRLLDITLGSDVPGYKNGETLDPFELYTGIPDQANDTSSNKPLLEKIILTGLTELDVFLDVRMPTKLQEFRALNTKLQYALFAEGAPLKIIHLPNTVTQLTFIQNKDLVKYLDKKPIVLQLEPDSEPLASGSYNPQLIYYYLNDMNEYVEYSTLSNHDWNADLAAGKIYLAKAIPNIYGEPVYKDKSEYEGLYIEGITDYNYVKDALSNEDSLIDIINFQGDALKYGSYKILRNVMAKKLGYANSGHAKSRLRIRMEDVNWSPYTKLEIGEIRKDNINYKYRTEHNTFIDYDRNSWDNDLIQGRIYTYDPNSEENIITNLDLLDTLIKDYEDAVYIKVTPGTLFDANKIYYIFENEQYQQVDINAFENGVTYYMIDDSDKPQINQFTNNNNAMSEVPSIASLSGTIHIANDAEHPISESLLTTKYGKYWENLDITANYVIESYIARYVDIDEMTGKEEDVVPSYHFDPELYNGLTPTIPTKIPSKIGSYFIGWATEPNSNNIAISYDIFTKELTPTEIFTNNVFSNDNSLIVYYAVYKDQQYGITIRDAIDDTLLILDTENPQYILNAQGEREQVTILVNSGEAIPGIGTILPVKDDSQLELTQTYKFIGYSTVNNAKVTKSTNTNTGITTYTINPSAPIVITEDTVLYSYFDEVSVYDNVLTESSYFNVYQTEINSQAYWTLELIKPNDISGKVTLPKEVNGHIIECFNNLMGNTSANISNTITHIFWEKGNSLQFVGARACQNWPNLKYFELPNNNMTILNSAFYGDNKLFDGINQELLDIWFSKIHTLGASSLMYIGSVYQNVNANQYLNGKIINLSNINTINNNALQGIVFYQLVIGSEENSNLNYNNNFGDQILTNSCSVPGIRPNSRSGIKIKLYDFSGRDTEAIKLELYEHFDLNTIDEGFEVQTSIA